MVGTKFTPAKKFPPGKVPCGAITTPENWLCLFGNSPKAKIIVFSKMTDPRKLTRFPTHKTPADFKAHLRTLGIDLPCDDSIAKGADSPLMQSVENVTINGKRIGNRIVIQPMEGWDGT